MVILTAHDLMLKTNYFLIRGGTFTDTERMDIANRLLAARSSDDEAKRFWDGIHYSGNRDENGREMYPIFFIPPYNGGKKCKSVLDQTPKTHIFSANLYELEILRLLLLLVPDDLDVKAMTGRTLSRLQTTCFGSEDDGVGECFDTSLVVLRFLCAASPSDLWRMKSRVDVFNKHYAEKKRVSAVIWYYWLCLSELPDEIALPEIEKYKPVMLNWLENKSCVMNSEHDRTLHPVLFSVLRNSLSRFPEYAYIKERQPFIAERDGRLHFDMTK